MGPRPRRLFTDADLDGTQGPKEASPRPCGCTEPRVKGGYLRPHAHTRSRLALFVSSVGTCVMILLWTKESRPHKH